MALKDLVSDLSNFKGQSQYDGLDSQIENGVDYFPDDTSGARGFTPSTDLLTKYNKFMRDVRENNTLPNVYVGQADVSAPNAGVRTNVKTKTAYGTQGEYLEANGVGVSSFPTHINSSDNVLGVRIQPKFTSKFMTTPIASYVSMFNPPANDSLTLTIAKKDGTGNFVFDNTNKVPNANGSDFMTTPLADYASKLSPPENISETYELIPNTYNRLLPNYTEYSNEFAPIGGGVFKFANIQPRITVYRDVTQRFSNYSTEVEKFKGGKYKTPKGFGGVQRTFQLTKEAFRRDETSKLDNLYVGGASITSFFPLSVSIALPNIAFNASLSLLNSVIVNDHFTIKK